MKIEFDSQAIDSESFGSISVKTAILVKYKINYLSANAVNKTVETVIQTVNSSFWIVH